MKHRSMLQASSKYNLLRIRTKISCMAFEKNMTVLELFLRTIYKEYNVLVSEKEIAYSENKRKEK